MAVAFRPAGTAMHYPVHEHGRSASAVVQLITAPLSGMLAVRIAFGIGSSLGLDWAGTIVGSAAQHSLRSAP